MTGLPVITADGSHTLYVPELKEHYHSTFGAINESMHVFIREGFRKINDKTHDLHILETGFGTGLNAFLTLKEAESSKKIVFYTSLEPDPISESTWSNLNYPDLVYSDDSRPVFNRLHCSAWNKEEDISLHFSLLKLRVKLETVQLPVYKFDLVYHDAFGPEIQPELWTNKIFIKLFNSMVNGGILVTYSSKGSVRRAMKEAGFMVERLPGPAGKRHITRANKII